MVIPNFITWFKNYENTFNTYNYETKENKILSKLERNINSFECLKGYEANNEGLKKFAEDITIWRNEILNSNILKKSFDYFDNSFKLSNGNIYYRDHSINIKTFIKKLLSKDYKNFEDITLHEEEYYDKCNNGGLVYHKEGIYEHVTSYDKKMFYPSIMDSQYFEFSISKGEICNIFKIPKNKFIYGIYNVKV